MRIIAVTNRKGGVGKSTMATHIAAGLAAMGCNVALVDTDSQGHAGLMLAMPDENGLYAALIEKQPLQDVVRLVAPESYSTPDLPSRGHLYLLPSSDRTYKVPFELRQEESFLFLEKLEEMGQLFALDAIIIDTNPTLSLFDGAVYLAADDYIYVTECERLSLDGVQSAVEQMQTFSRQRRKYLNRESRVMGIIPNKFRANTLIHRENISAIAQHFNTEDRKIVWPPVTLRTAWVEAANLQELVYTYAPTGQETRDAWDVVRRTAEAIEWQTNASA
jgi:chromosome partitioning protein